jgi:hypothetical protein
VRTLLVRALEGSPTWDRTWDRLALPFEKLVLIVAGKQGDSVGCRDAWKMMELFLRATFAIRDKAGRW